MNIDPKYHRHFVVRRGEVLREIADNFGGVAVSFPRNNTDSDVVTVKGARGCVDGAVKRLLEIVEDLVSVGKDGIPSGIVISMLVEHHGNCTCSNFIQCEVNFLVSTMMFE